MNRREYLQCLPLLALAAAQSRTAYSQSGVNAPMSRSTRTETGELKRSCQSAPGSIRLPYRRLHRGQSGRPACFFLGGGPGVSNLGFTPPESWLDHFDVIQLEYRGVGQSSLKLDAPCFGQALRQPLARLDLPGSGAMRELLAEGFQDLRQQGLIFEEFGLAAMADDIEALRQQLALGPILLVSHSFGTRVAQMMQTRYRRAVQGSLLLSANIPGGLIWFPDDTQSVWRRWCQSDEARASGLAEPIARLLETGWERPDGWQPNDSRALVLAFFLSFNRSSRQRALSSILNASRGSSPVWWLMGQSYPLFTRYSFNWADFFLKGYLIDGDMHALRQCNAQGSKALFQSPSAMLYTGLSEFLGEFAEREPQPPIDYQNTLLVTGEFDPSTPIERWPDTLSAQQRIVLPGAGHAEALGAAARLGPQWLARLLHAPQPKSHATPT